MITLKSYIDRLSLEPNANKALLEFALRVYVQLLILCPHLSEPDACPGDTDFMLVWDSPKHYLECEIFPNNVIEFFYRNKLTGGVWGGNWAIDWPLSPNLKHFLELFLSC